MQPTTELPPTLQRAREQLDDAYESLRTHGLWLKLEHTIDEEGRWIKRPAGYPSSSLRRVVREIAREMKRPLVLAERKLRYVHTPTGYRYHDDMIWVTVKTIKKLAPIRASLDMLATEVHQGWRQSSILGIRCNKFTKQNLYYFSGSDACEVFYVWLEQVKTNPDLRKAVGLPTE